ncbi:CLEC12B [Mytilus coruscus]|uniref:CLEC12B n=1 Tax=Mytilus coruscus TaxID=42192 RepID=A0A6J8AI55_MYTCO|nr:CLEC12B [Mytilus coruscus]
MSKEIELHNILQTEDWNKSEPQTRESIGTNVVDDKLAEIRKASKKKDKIICALTVVLLVGFSLAVAVVAMHLKAYYIEKSSKLDKQMQQLALNTSGLERQVQTLSNQLGERGQKGEKGSPGESAFTVRCGSGWEQLMNSCYYFQFQSKKTWNDAKSDCQNMGGFLVKIDNAFENWFLKSYIKTGLTITCSVFNDSTGLTNAPEIKLVDAVAVGLGLGVAAVISKAIGLNSSFDANAARAVLHYVDHSLKFRT